MKTYIIKFITYTFSFCLLIGCSDDLNDLYPKHAIPKENLTESDISKLLNGTYAEMEELIFKFYFDGDVKGENFRGGPGFSLNDPVSMAPGSADVLSKWQKCFTSLKQVNFLIEVYEGTNTDSKVVREAGGAAYYFRALLYYHLVTRWGGVPIVRELTEEIVPISPEADVWKFIADDLSKAEKLLSVFSDKYYVSLSACDALSAKVYLSLKDNAKALEYANKVLGESKFTLSASSQEYAATYIFGNNSKETIFALANKRSSGYLLFYQWVNDLKATWEYSPASDCFNSLFNDTDIKKGDLRAIATFSGDESRIIKFANGGQGQFISNEIASQSPIVVNRIAEIYLIKAEALGNINGLSTLKEFMQKRYRALSLPSSLSEKDFQNLLLDERHREFYGEGQRWYDLKRTNRLDLFKTLDNRKYLMYFPIPQSEIDLAGKQNYPQNPGYN